MQTEGIASSHLSLSPISFTHTHQSYFVYMFTSLELIQVSMTTGPNVNNYMQTKLSSKRVSNYHLKESTNRTSKKAPLWNVQQVIN
ncbi:hypothetical protein X798_02795 [Onchocerca flexuosa]|uniref:Ovule protein n=2 Tax=Onchocerca flexuosa TaxID=387005 RepID=A0A183HGC6_9BILA|nr:hypothetical protein X798_02795 [Onchocerca flexuosa]VDO46871.1 unnamed protein product [Onchocerca flexuosa]